ncbi:MAG: transposase [Rhodobacteraceae bacterium]|nr:transposase [Paracoccaceae bacterium]
MSDYQRVHLTGAAYFFTVALADRTATTLVDHIDLLRSALQVTQAKRPFHCDAFVVLPDHLHAVWTPPQGDADYSVRWGAIKSRFTRAVKSRVGFYPTIETNNDKGRVVGWNPTLRSASKVRKGDAGLWQRRFWEHCIRDEADYAAHVRYCWGNPVKYGLVERAVDWPNSSIHRDIRAGRVEPEWAGEIVEGGFGEP